MTGVQTCALPISLVASFILAHIQGRRDRKIFLVGKDNNKSIFYYLGRYIKRLPNVKAVKEAIVKL